MLQSSAPHQCAPPSPEHSDYLLNILRIEQDAPRPVPRGLHFAIAVFPLWCLPALQAQTPATGMLGPAVLGMCPMPPPGQQTLPHPMVSLRLPGSPKVVSRARILTCLKAWSLPNWEKPWAEQARETWVRVRSARKAFLPSAPSKPPPGLFRETSG